jgi:hypothetical protein
MKKKRRINPATTNAILRKRETRLVMPDKPKRGLPFPKKVVPIGMKTF